MFFLYVLSPLFVLTYIYTRYFLNYQNIDKKKLTFDDNKKNNTFILLTIEHYSSDLKENHSIVYNKKCSCKNKIKIDNLDSLNINENNQLQDNSNNNSQKNNYNIVNYIYDNKTYKALIRENSFEFPIINEVKTYVYLNKIKSIEIMYDDSIKNITEILLDYIGPNYDFNYETDYKQDIDIILKIEELIDINKNYQIKIIDNFDNEVYIKDKLFWKPSIF